MRGGGRNFFLCVLYFPFRDIFENNLRLLSIFQRNLGPSRTNLATYGIVRIATLVNSFQLWTEVEKISILNVVGDLDTPLYLVYKLFKIYSVIKVF